MTMRFEYDFVKILCSFIAGLSLPIAIISGYWLAYVAVVMSVVDVVVAIAVQKHNESATLADCSCEHV